MPMMAFMGVRTSWLIRRRKSSCTPEAFWAIRREESAWALACRACFRLACAAASAVFNSWMRRSNAPFIFCRESNMPASSSPYFRRRGAGSLPAATSSA